MGDLLRLAIVLSSVREARFGPTVSRWFTDQARGHAAFDVDHIDLADHELPWSLSTRPSPEVRVVLDRLTPRLAGADAFVIVTPEYNRSFPASIKSLVDWNYLQWQAKPVGFVSYGGMAGGTRAVEQLRPVFAELHAVTIRDLVSFHNAWDLFDEDGELHDPADATAAAKVMLDQLAWWATALRTARASQPYGD